MAAMPAMRPDAPGLAEQLSGAKLVQAVMVPPFSLAKNAMFSERAIEQLWSITIFFRVPVFTFTRGALAAQFFRE